MLAMASSQAELFSSKATFLSRVSTLAEGIFANGFGSDIFKNHASGQGPSADGKVPWYIYCPGGLQDPG